MALASSNRIKIFLNSSARILESCSLMSLWLFCWWLWTSQCSVYQVCRKIIFCSFGMFEFLLRSILFCLSFEYCWFYNLGVHSDFALSIWASPAKFKQFWPIYRFFQPEKFGQTQKLEKQKYCLRPYFKSWLRFGCVFFAQ